MRESNHTELNLKNKQTPKYYFKQFDYTRKYYLHNSETNVVSHFKGCTFCKFRRAVSYVVTTRNCAGFSMMRFKIFPLSESLYKDPQDLRGQQLPHLICPERTWCFHGIICSLVLSILNENHHITI